MGEITRVVPCGDVQNTTNTNQTMDGQLFINVMWLCAPEDGPQLLEVTMALTNVTRLTPICPSDPAAAIDGLLLPPGTPCTSSPPRHAFASPSSATTEDRVGCSWPPPILGVGDDQIRQDCPCILCVPDPAALGAGSTRPVRHHKGEERDSSMAMSAGKHDQIDERLRAG